MDAALAASPHWYQQEWLWVAAGSFVSAGVAIATFRLATFTKSLAQKTAELSLETRESINATRDAITQEDRRHRNSLQAHVAIDITSVRNERSPGTIFSPNQIHLLTVTNIGPGFASAVRFDIVTDEFGVTDYTPPGGLGANQSRVILRDFDPGKLSKITLTYEDPFGMRYESLMDHPFVVGSPYKVQLITDSSQLKGIYERRSVSEADDAPPT